MHQYTYLIANVLNTLTETLGIRNYHVDVVVAVVGAGVIAPRPQLSLCIAVFVAFLVLSLLDTHVGCLHMDKAFLMCSSSKSRLGEEQTVLVLCVRVLNTLYLADKFC